MRKINKKKINKMQKMLQKNCGKHGFNSKVLADKLGIEGSVLDDILDMALSGKVDTDIKDENQDLKDLDLNSLEDDNINEEKILKDGVKVLGQSNNANIQKFINAVSKEL